MRLATFATSDGTVCAGEVVGEREVEQPLDRRPEFARLLKRRDRARAIHEAQAQPPEALPGRSIVRGALRRAVGGIRG